MKEVENENALKHMFDRRHLKRSSDALIVVHPSFDRKRYMATLSRLEPLEMKARVRTLSDELHELLPKEYPKALSILMKTAVSGNLESFDVWPIAEFIQTYGINDVAISLAALKKITTIFTSESAVRPFIKKYPKETLKFLLSCAKSSDIDVRRWASEGTRPRLPWSERLHDFIAKPNSTNEILEQLKYDDELFVRKSVANHINDIAKDHPDYAVDLLRRWKKEATSKDQKKLDWIVRRAMRVLI